MTSLHIKARVLHAAQNYNHSEFRASNGWLQKFIRRSAIKKSFKLHGKGRLSFSADNSARMQEIRYICSQYKLSDIYNMAESELFFRMGPCETFQTAVEDRRTTRGKDLQKHKRRTSIVMCVNVDRTHDFPVSYIGAAA